MNKMTFRIVRRGRNGMLQVKDYPSSRPLLRAHSQIGIEDTSTELSLRGLPLLKGLVGPMLDVDGTVRYESHDVFESETENWTKQTTKPIDASSTKKSRRSRPCVMQ